jgi:hypothetical protein
MCMGVDSPTLSHAMNSARSLFMMDSFSISRLNAKFVKIDPVVGLYTLYSSWSMVETVLSDSGSDTDFCSVSCKPLVACTCGPLCMIVTLTENRPWQTTLKYSERVHSLCSAISLRSQVPEWQTYRMRWTGNDLWPAMTVKSEHSLVL